MAEQTTQNDVVKTFTQDELNAIVQDRLGREKSKFADYEENKKKVSDYEARLKTFEDAAKTERELEVERAVKLARAEAEKPYKDQIAALRSENLKIRLVSEKGTGLLPGYRLMVTGNNDDEITASIKAALDQQAKDLEAAKIGAKTPTPNLGGGGAGGVSADSRAAESLTPEELNICAKFRMKPEDYVKNKAPR